MANSGVIYGTVTQRSSTYRSAIYWREVSQEIDNNRTELEVEVLVDSNSFDDWDGTVRDFQVKINGTTYTRGYFNSDSNSGWSYSASSSPTGEKAEIIDERTVWVNHNSDGSKSVSLSTSFNLPSGGWGPGYVDVDGTATLDTIPRTSEPTLNDYYVYAGDPVTIYTNRASSSFTHTITYAFNSDSGTIATGVGTSTSWTLPMSLLNQIPNSTSGSGRIYCKTYSGGTYIGQESVGISIYADSSIKPSISSVTHSEYYQSIRDFIGSNTGPYVQDQSRLNLYINGASGTYGSTISSYEITFDSKKYNGSDVNSNQVNGSGTLTITGKVTDSRGRTETKSTNVTVLAYDPPQVTQFTINRADSGGTPDDLGNYANVDYSTGWNDLVNRNNVNIVIKSKLRGSTSWNIKDTQSAVSGGSDSGTITIGTYSELESHDFRIEVTDEWNTSTTSSVLPTGQVTMSWGKYGVGIGKVWEQGALDVRGDTYLTGELDVNGGALITGALDVNGGANVTGGLVVDSLNASNDIQADGNISSVGSISASGGLTSNGDADFNGDVTVQGSVFLEGSGGFIHKKYSSTNYDIIWHDDGTNEWHFVSDGDYNDTGNGKLVALDGNFSGDVTVDGALRISEGGASPFDVITAHHNGSYGNGIKIQAAQGMLVSAGEAGNGIVTNEDLHQENLWLASDGGIRFLSDQQSGYRAEGSGKYFVMDYAGDGSSGGEPTLRPNDSGGWGFLGTDTDHFFYLYTTHYVNKSTLKDKTDVAEVNLKDMKEFVKSLKPKEYVYNKEKEEHLKRTNKKGNLIDNRFVGLGVEDIDKNHPLAHRILDRQESGIDGYAYTTMIAGALIQTIAEVEELQAEVIKLKNKNK